MTENVREEMLKDIKDGYIDEWDNLTIDELFEQIEREHNEIQQYRAIGTVEELIKEHKELIELSRRYLIDTNELLEYQAIGTVEQLKAIKQWKSDVMEGFCKYDASSFEEIVANARAKAIDEFAEKIQWEYLNSCGLKQREIDFLVAVSSAVAEQLKGGGNDVETN